MGAIELFGQRPGGLDKLGAIQQHKRLEGRVGGVAADHADHPLRHVEGLQHRGRTGAPPEGVDAAAVKVLSLAGGGGLE